MSLLVPQLKQKRGRFLASLTRARRRASVLVDSRGSRTQLASVIPELNGALQQLEEVTDTLSSVLTTEEELDQVRVYLAEAEKQHEEAVSNIEEYLKARKDDPPSVVSRQTAQSATSGASSSRMAEVEAKVKKLELAQLKQRLETEKEAQEIQRRLQLQGATDAHVAAELRAQLAGAAEDDLSWERRDNFCGEAKVCEAPGARPEVSSQGGEQFLPPGQPDAVRPDVSSAALVACPSAVSGEAQGAQPETSSRGGGQFHLPGTVVDVRPDVSSAAFPSAVPVEAQGARPEVSSQGGRQFLLPGPVVDVRPVYPATAVACPSAVPGEAQGARPEVGSQGRGQFLSSGPVEDSVLPNFPSDVPVVHPPAANGNHRGECHTATLFSRSIPRLTLPKFSGEPGEWPKWSALFRTLVGNQTALTSTEKMVHLQASVAGLAQHTISGMLYDGSLYEEALRVLEDRFGCQEDVVHASLQKIFSCSSPVHLDPVSLEQFHAAVHCAVMMFKKLGYEGDLTSFENLRRVAQKLPAEMKRLWGEHILDLAGERPNLMHFDLWLGKQVRVALNYAAVSGQQKKTAPERKPARLPQQWQSDMKTTHRSTLVTEAETSPEPCVCCKGMHVLSKCPVFLQKPVDDRAHFIASTGCCFFCLRRGHGVRHCRSARPCSIDNCKMRHHQVLHGSKRVGNRDSDRRVVAAASLGSDAVTTLLQVVPVTVLGSDGRTKEVCALLDPGSQTSLVLEEVLDQLDLRGERQALSLQNVEGSGPLHSSMKLKLELEASCGDGSKIHVPEVFSVKDINVMLPELPNKRPDWKHLKDIDFPDCSGRRVELLLGANVVEAVLQLEARTGKAGQPVAIRTVFGWTLTGSVKGFVPERKRQVMLISKMKQDDDMSAMLQEWWTTESFGSRFEGEDAKSPEDIRAMKIMESTTQRLDNRYETGLLWKSDDVSLPDNKAMAINRLHSLEKSLLRQPQKAEMYRRVLEGYVERGFARKLTPEEDEVAHPRKWYLPHHGVTNPRKPGKLRVVFDAAARCGGTSLNEALLTGPDLLRNLPGILLRFRENPVALTADIECMYHQVKIVQQDQPSLRFIWRDLEATKKMESYSMQVAIFGAKCSPASASFVLQRTAKDCSRSTPAGQAAREAAMTNFYMDDFVHASRTEEEAVEMRREMTELLRKGGFRLTKWMSSSQKVMEQIEAKERAQAGITQSVLGCTWNTVEDTLGVRSIDPHVPETKRGVVQGVARLYDPLGLLSPFSLQAKILIQRLWAGDYRWDDQLGPEELQIWKEWLSELPSTGLMTVPRCFSGAEVSADCTRELHTFCDASQYAFGAVAYIRTMMPDGRTSCSLAMSKTRVAPLKQISIVRLELQAAVLGVRLTNLILKESGVKMERVVFWTDSTVVLQYVKNDSRRFHTFVANRVAEIRESSHPDQWRHVPSSLNAADVCSRGASLCRLANSSWSAGPEFLLKKEECWPEQPSSSAVLMDDPEVREKPVVLTLSTKPKEAILPEAGKFSSWTRYRRVVAWMIRFVKNFVAKNCQRRAEWRRQGPLSAEEVQQAETRIIADCQARCFATEITAIKTGEQVKLEGRLRQTSPFLDGEGVMRVGGRLDKAPVAYSTRHPVILPPRDDVTQLIVTYNHVKVLHSGQERTLTEVRKSFWIPKARSAVRRILFKCQACKRRRATPQVPRMADLPVSRFDTSRAFSSVGVDYFGPMLVKKYRKTEKRYGVLFTCLSTRAVHLEVANSLDTDSFLMALRRFIARRGKPDSMYSDNGTNLVGGERELRESLQEFDQARIADNLSQDHIKWTFMPPSASHMGGVWERLVGSVKRALRVTIGSQCVTDEVLHTALLEVEAMVNGRPLTYVSSDSADVEPLTPNHLLLGCASMNMSPGLFHSQDLTSRRRWRQSQILANHFWKRWRQEYVPILTTRQKWLRERRNLRVGDVVMMADADSPRGFWPLARVVSVFPGADGVVRSVEVVSSGGGKYHRPVSKVCLLEEAE